MHWDNLTMSYSYQEAEKWFISAAVRSGFRGEKMNTRSLLYPIDNPADNVAMKDFTSSDSKSPSIDIYLQRNLKNNPAIDRIYEEKKHSAVVTDIYSATRGKKYSFIGEGIYEKKFNGSKLSAGIRHQQSLTKNRYAGTSSAETRMQEAHTSTYIEYSSKIKKFKYSQPLMVQPGRRRLSAILIPAPCTAHLQFLRQLLHPLSGKNIQSHTLSVRFEQRRAAD